MKIAKEFLWEMGHRLPFHEGKCKNLHGHSYKCIVEIAGKPDENGMVLDYYELKKITEPVFEKLDHSFMVWGGDKELIEMLTKINSKIVIVDFQTTVENICIYLLEELRSASFPKNIESIKVQVSETKNTYAEDEIRF